MVNDSSHKSPDNSERNLTAKWPTDQIIVAYTVGETEVPSLIKAPRKPRSGKALINEIYYRVRRELALDVVDDVLSQTSVRLFGSWDNALEAASYDAEAVRHGKVPVMDEEAALVKLQELLTVDLKPRGSVVQTSDRRLYAAAIYYWRSWSNALDSAGRVPRRISLKHDCLNEVLMPDEAARMWNVEVDDVRRACQDGRLRENECRHTGTDWLILRHAMVRLFGPTVS